MMKKITVIALALVVGLIFASGAYAWWGGHRMGHGMGYGTGYGTGTNVETMKKFQTETLSLRDDLMTKEIELRSEYNKPVTDTNRVVALTKEIIDLQAKIQTVAEKYGISAGGPMGGMMMGGGTMMGHGMMMDMCPMGRW